jgi:hypothetical protein
MKSFVHRPVYFIRESLYKIYRVGCNNNFNVHAYLEERVVDLLLIELVAEVPVALQESVRNVF